MGGRGGGCQKKCVSVKDGTGLNDLLPTQYIRIQNSRERKYAFLTAINSVNLCKRFIF
jgi:hypothetical protein